MKEKAIRNDIHELKKSLNELNIQKETWFDKKENLKKDISNLITKIKSVKFHEDKSSEEIKKLKEERDKYNKEVQELIKQFRETKKKKEKMLKEKKISFDPSKIIKKIEELEFKIETEAISFEKEQQVMKQIKQFKKQLDEVKEVQDTFRELKSLSDQITEKKKIADEFHNKILAHKKGNGYTEFIDLTKKITQLKKEQEEAFNKFIESKEKFSKVNEQLKTKLREAKQLGERIVTKNKQEIDLQIKEKTKQVEEKLKTKKKLTTEDLIVYQGSEEENKSDTK